MQKEKEIWELTINEINRILDFGDFAMNLWFGSTMLEKLSESKAYISIDGDFEKEIIEGKYMVAVRTALKNILGFEVEPIFISTSKESFQKQLERLLCNDESDSMIEKAIEELDCPEGFDKKSLVYAEMQAIAADHDYTFENFVVGSTNNIAHATCKGMAIDPKCSYNPLFIYGPPGLGKTHLLNAVVREVRIRRPSAKIVYVKCEDFTNELVAAIGSNSTPRFREKYRTADLLLVDDIQFIGGKTSTQEEYFHTFNTLYESGKQIIMASDRPPKAISNLEERLRSRFEQGVTADIQPPDLELRIAIFKRKSLAMGIEIPNDVLMYLGDAITDNIRQIEGVITKMKVMSYLQGETVCIDLAKRVVNDIANPNAKQRIRPEDIIKRVAEAYNVTTEDIVGKKKDREIMKPRYISTYLIREMLELSLPTIAKLFNKDHSTIIYSVNSMKKSLNESEALRAEIEQLKKDIISKNRK